MECRVVYTVRDFDFFHILKLLDFVELTGNIPFIFEFNLYLLSRPS